MQESELILTHLKALFREVRRVVTTGSAHQPADLGRNPKGDRVRWFDLAADEAVCAYLAGSFPGPVRLLSEEGAPRHFGAAEPEFTIVLDPVDGSENFSRGLAPAAMAAALIPANLPVAVETVQFALVGDLFSGSVWFAVRGQGAFCDDRPLQTSSVTHVEDALLSCDLNNSFVETPFARVLSRALGVRAFGSATLDLARVADGIFDAHLNLGDTLTPENFLAPSLLITEAGGVFTGPAGLPLPPIQSLTEGYPILAAGTPELHSNLVKQLQTKIGD